jgi:hypothetical protein
MRCFVEEAEGDKFKSPKLDILKGRTYISQNSIRNQPAGQLRDAWRGK